MNRPVRARRPPRVAGPALAMGALLGALAVSLAQPPVSWTAVDRRASDMGSSWSSTLALLVEHIPVLERFARLEVALAAGVIAAAAAATWAAYQLYRGPGRRLAAAASGPLVAVCLAPHVASTPSSSSLRELLFTVLVTLSVGSVLRSLVHLGTVTAPARARSIAAAGCAAALLPLPGVPVFLTIVFVSLVRVRGENDAPPSASRIGRPSLLWPSMLVGLLPVGMLLAAGVVSDDLVMPDLPRLTVGLPRNGWLAEVPATVGYPAVALVAVLVLPLRWRGGLTLSALFLGALLLHVDDHPLAPAPSRIVLLATAACGWIWLAGTLTPRRPAVGRGLAVGATIVTASLRLGPADLTLARAVERDRPTRSLLAVHLRGLLGAGDVVVLHAPWLRDVLLERQAGEGLRPDVLIVDATLATADELRLDALEWAADGRRVLSDSFNLGGHWDPAWAVDGGPFFWFVGAAGHTTEFIDLSAFVPAPDDALGRANALQWELLHVERARFRRTRDRPDEALRALPFSEDDRELLQRRRQASVSRRPRAPTASELPGYLGISDVSAGTLALAEGGDLLMASGELELGERLLLQAADRGMPYAWGALARWRLRAGSHFGAREILGELAGREELRREALRVMGWLVARGRVEEARALRDGLAPARTAVAHELAARLSLLTALVPVSE